MLRPRNAMNFSPLVVGFSTPAIFPSCFAFWLDLAVPPPPIIYRMTNTQFVDIHERFFARVTIGYCRSCRICLDRDNTGTYKLFVTNRTKPFVVDSIRRLIKDPLSFVVVDDIDLDRRIDLAFEAIRLANRTQEPSGNAENPVAAVLHSADDTNDLLQDQSATPVIELVNRILFDAVQQQASDIHFQPFENAMVVRMRMDGVLFAEEQRYQESLIGKHRCIHAEKPEGAMNCFDTRTDQRHESRLAAGNASNADGLDTWLAIRCGQFRQLDPTCGGDSGYRFVGSVKFAACSVWSRPMIGDNG